MWIPFFFERRGGSLPVSLLLDDFLHKRPSETEHKSHFFINLVHMFPCWVVHTQSKCLRVGLGVSGLHKSIETIETYNLEFRVPFNIFNGTCHCIAYYTAHNG